MQPTVTYDYDVIHHLVYENAVFCQILFYFEFGNFITIFLVYFDSKKGTECNNFLQNESLDSSLMFQCPAGSEEISSRNNIFCLDQYRSWLPFLSRLEVPARSKVPCLNPLAISAYSRIRLLQRGSIKASFSLFWSTLIIPYICPELKSTLLPLFFYLMMYGHNNYFPFLIYCHFFFTRLRYLFELYFYGTWYLPSDI